MTEWSLAQLLSGLHEDIQNNLAIAREAFAHAPTKGDASETVWLEFFNAYLPQRYRAITAHVVDSEGHFSEQIDAVIFDRQYSPFIFNFKGQAVIPAESVYAAFEAKQTITAAQVQYAGTKVASVRRLHRTSLPIPYAGGVYPAKEPGHIVGGILTFESEWKPALGQPLQTVLNSLEAAGQLDLGCIAAHGIFYKSADAPERAAPPERAVRPERAPADARAGSKCRGR